MEACISSNTTLEFHSIADSGEAKRVFIRSQGKVAVWMGPTMIGRHHERESLACIESEQERKVAAQGTCRDSNG